MSEGGLHFLSETISVEQGKLSGSNAMSRHFVPLESQSPHRDNMNSREATERIRKRVTKIYLVDSLSPTWLLLQV